MTDLTASLNDNTRGGKVVKDQNTAKIARIIWGRGERHLKKEKRRDKGTGKEVKVIRGKKYHKMHKESECKSDKGKGEYICSCAYMGKKSYTLPVV